MGDFLLARYIYNNIVLRPIVFVYTQGNDLSRWKLGGAIQSVCIIGWRRRFSSSDGSSPVCLSKGSKQIQSDGLYSLFLVCFLRFTGPTTSGRSRSLSSRSCHVSLSAGPVFDLLRFIGKKQLRGAKNGNGPFFPRRNGHDGGGRAKEEKGWVDYWSDPKRERERDVRNESRRLASRHRWPVQSSAAQQKSYLHAPPRVCST